MVSQEEKVGTGIYFSTCLEHVLALLTDTEVTSMISKNIVKFVCIVCITLAFNKLDCGIFTYESARICIVNNFQ